MGESKLILNKDFLTDKANLAEMNFRDKQPEEEWKYNPEKTDAILSDGRLKYLPFLVRHGAKVHGKVIEIGAGMCWFSSEVSKLNEVNKVYALEFSEYMLKTIAPRFMQKLNAKTDKIIRIQGDFNALSFENSFFDFALVDATLHHATNLNHLLKEINRVLKPGGILIAIREPIVPSWRPWTKDTFGKEDRKRGITENIYSFSEWQDFFRNAGFKPRFIPFMPSAKPKQKLVSLLMPLNRQLLGHYIFVARKS